MKISIVDGNASPVWLLRIYLLNAFIAVFFLFLPVTNMLELNSIIIYFSEIFPAIKNAKLITSFPDEYQIYLIVMLFVFPLSFAYALFAEHKIRRQVLQSGYIKNCFFCVFFLFFSALLFYLFYFMGYKSSVSVSRGSFFDLLMNGSRVGMMVFGSFIFQAIVCCLYGSFIFFISIFIKFKIEYE